MQFPFKARTLDGRRPLKRLDPTRPLDWYTRYRIFGPVRSMNYPTLLDRILGR